VTTTASRAHPVTSGAPRGAVDTSLLRTARPRRHLNPRAEGRAAGG